MRTGIFLSVREKATRFPGKVLKTLGGKSITAFLLDRLKTSTLADIVVLTTSTDPRDQVLCKIASDLGTHSFRGSHDDKLLRYRDAARRFDLDFCVIVDGDDPFVSIEHIDRIIGHAHGHNEDFIVCGDLPLGATGFGLRRDAVERVCENRPESDTEIWGSLFLDNPAYQCITLEEPNMCYRRPDIRMTLDYPEDYAFFTAVVDGLITDNRPITFRSIMDYLSVHPELTELNQSVQELYERHQQKSIS